MRILTKVLALLMISAQVLAQAPAEKPKPNWQNLDLKQDGQFGISTEKAYKELIKNKKGSEVIVAVIDGGVDVNHEDLKSLILKNSKEIAGNGIDDDKNGYVDDVNGWNFIGSSKGNIHYDNMEVIRLYNKLAPKYSTALPTTPFSPEERKEFQQYKKVEIDYMGRLQNARIGYENMSLVMRTIDSIKSKQNKTVLTLADIENYKPANTMESLVIKFIKSGLKEEPELDKLIENFKEGKDYYNVQLKYNLNIDYDPRDSVGDDYANSNERIYGNNDVAGPDAEHGTHVAGIIAAIRNNDLGINGVANHVRILPVRVVPNGDERDKDVANGIRYAVDRGAKIINMSFGKAYPWDKKVVDEAVKYAMSKGVLLVHAAGNDAENSDKTPNYPNKFYNDSVTNANIGQAEGWIAVGASGYLNDESLAANFSNYGKQSVDVFAPGVKINSTMPGSKYKENDGTSMAAPVVSGLAALIWSYYPDLKASQIREIIMNSVTKVDQKVKVRGDDGVMKKVPFSDLCISGGIVNAYSALQLAEEMHKTTAR